MCRIRVNFVKDYQKDSYNKTHLMKNKIKGYKPINHIKKHSYLKICQIIKLKKFKELSKIDSKFYNFKSPLPHINWVKCT